MGTYENKANKCVSCMFNLCNLLLILEGLLVMALGIYLAVETKRAGVFEIFFISLGCAEWVFAIIGCTIKRSVHGLNCYLLILIIIFLF